MFDLPPSVSAYLLILPCFGLALLGWLLYGLLRAPERNLPFKPYGLGLLLAVGMFVLVNLAVLRLGDMFTQTFDPPAQPPFGASDVLDRPYNEVLELALGAFYFVANVASCAWSFWCPLRLAPKVAHVSQNV